MVQGITIEISSNNDPMNQSCNTNPNNHTKTSASTSRVTPTLPPAGFSPPMNINKRSPKADVVLTANANSRVISSSTTMDSPFSVALPARNITLESCQGEARVSSFDKSGLTGKNNKDENRGSIGDEKVKSSQRKGVTPNISSIAADFDLAAKESNGENDNPFSNQTNQETMRQIDAVMTASADEDHDDDTDLGFDFTSSPTKNDDCLSSIKQESPISQRISARGSFTLGSETPSNRELTTKNSFPLPSPPTQTAFQQRHNMNMNKVHRSIQATQGTPSAMNSSQFPNSTQYDIFQQGTYQNHPSIQNSSVLQHTYGPKLIFHTTGPRFTHSSSDNNSNFHVHSNREGSAQPVPNYYDLATPRLARKSELDGKNEHLPTLSPRAKEKSNGMSKGGNKKTPLRSPPVKKRRVVEAWDENSKKREIDVIPIGSPNNVFRSPQNHFRRSPLLSKASISFGGSFEMDSSPNPKFEEMFHASTSFEIGENLLSDDVIMNNPVPKKDSQHDKESGSPSLMFDTVLSPLRSSPNHKRVVGGDRNMLKSLDILGTFEASPLPPPKQSPINSAQNSLISKSSISLSMPSSQHMVRGNVITNPAKRGNIPFASPSPFGLRVGSMLGAPKNDSQTSLGTIDSAAKRRQVHPHQVQIPVSDKRTVIKTETPMKKDRMILSTPSNTVKMSGYSSSTRMQPPLSVPRTNFIKTASTPPTPVDGKENQSPQQQRRTPCNCKKSNCLKLYCVCFQAKVYCDGCNCVDCNNTKEKEEIRMKAIKDTVAKNPNAFKPRFSSKKIASHDDPNPSEGHNLGCRCKKSQCLKKYCECFEAGVTCSDKCKCIECQNYVGSQQLIDRRRKIKDHRGAELAMRSSHDAWKNGLNSNTIIRTTIPPATTVYPSPAPRMGQALNMYPMTMISPSPPGSNVRPGAIPPHFLGRSQMVMTSVGYSPLGMQPVTPAYTTTKPNQTNDGKQKYTPTPYAYFQHRSRQPQSTPRKKAPTRKKFDTQLVRKKYAGDTKTKHVFGPSNVAQKKVTSLIIFSFLSNDDIYNASLVCKDWNKLLLHEELWKYDKR